MVALKGDDHGVTAQAATALSATFTARASTDAGRLELVSLFDKARELF